MHIGAGFQHHFDSRYRWGETVVGVSLGQPSTIYFVPGNAKTKKKGAPPQQQQSDVEVRVKHYPKSDSFAIDITLPRRSIYVMSGASRVDWKHGIRQQPKNIPQTPSWNPHAIRRSLTLRATKPYSDVCLEQLVRDNPNDESLKQRLKAQQKFRDTANKDMEGDRRRARELLNMLQHFLPSQARFNQEEVTFPLPPEAVAASNALGSSTMGGIFGMGGGGISSAVGGLDFSGLLAGRTLNAADTMVTTNRFPGGGQVISSPSSGGTKKRKASNGEDQKMSPAEMRRRRLQRFSPEEKKEDISPGKGSSEGGATIDLTKGGTIDLTNSSDEEDVNDHHATNSDEEDEQLRRAIALSMK